MTDALEMLEADHRKVERLYDTYTNSPDPAVVQQICSGRPRRPPQVLV